MLQWTQWNREANLCGDCIYCLRSYPSYCGKHRFTEGEDDLAICPDFERKKNMPNIKITAEVDGKQVPLNTISTESFEAIKALEKPKEIPVARLATYDGSPRLLLRMTQDIADHIKFGYIIAIDPVNGGVTASWKKEHDANMRYENIKPL